MLLMCTAPLVLALQSRSVGNICENILSVVAVVVWFFLSCTGFPGVASLVLPVNDQTLAGGLVLLTNTG